MIKARSSDSGKRGAARGVAVVAVVGGLVVLALSLVLFNAFPESAIGRVVRSVVRIHLPHPSKLERELFFWMGQSPPAFLGTDEDEVREAVRFDPEVRPDEVARIRIVRFLSHPPTVLAPLVQHAEVRITVDVGPHGEPVRGPGLEEVRSEALAVLRSSDLVWRPWIGPELADAPFDRGLARARAISVVGQPMGWMLNAVLIGSVVSVAWGLWPRRKRAAPPQ